MGLTLTVGNPSDAFLEPFGDIVRRTLESHFGEQFVTNSNCEPFLSEELAWSGWRILQERAESVLPKDKIAHFLSMDAWQGVYVPCETEIGAFSFEGDSPPLDIASLDRLLDELHSIGCSLGLPTDQSGIQDLPRRCIEDDDLSDDDTGIQTYCELFLAAREANRRNQPLWIVK